MSGFFGYIMKSDYLNDKAVFDSCLMNVSAYRQDKVNRLARIEDKRDSLAAGVLLSYMLRKIFDVCERSVLYDKGEKGKPYIIGRPDICFSISHTDGYVAVLLSKAPCGIDIERVKKFPPTIVNRLYSSNDREILAHNIDSELLKDVYAEVVWTRRESYSKLTGTGILMKDEAQIMVMDEDYLKNIDISAASYICDGSGELIDYRNIFDECYCANTPQIAVSMCIKGLSISDGSLLICDTAKIYEGFMFHNS